MTLIPYTYNNLSLLIRDGQTAAAERDIIKEVQTAYAWDFPIETAIDVGAHIGAWTLECKRRNPRAWVAAVEVDPQNYDILEQNTQGLRDVMLFNQRAGYEPGAYVIGRDLKNSGSTAVYRLGDEFNQSAPYKQPHLEWTHAPSMITLEDIMNICGMIDFIDVLKLDCEGAEVEILNHISEDALSRVQRIVGEIHTPPEQFNYVTQGRLFRAGFMADYRPHPGDTSLFYMHAWRA